VNCSLGIDEVGWGAGAGPILVAGAAILHPVPGLRDSKLIAENVRERMYDELFDACVYVHFAFRDHKFINIYGMAAAWQTAAFECLTCLQENVPGTKVVVDGGMEIKKGTNYHLLPKADNLIAGVMAASVLAKVERDRLMRVLHKEHPQYGWDRNKGYLTKMHIAALKQHGMCDLHRAKAVRRFTNQRPRLL